MSDPVAVWSGELSICGVSLHLHVLDDGQRIIEAHSLDALMDAWQQGAEMDPADAAGFARWQRGGDQP